MKRYGSVIEVLPEKIVCNVDMIPFPIAMFKRGNRYGRR